MMTGQAPYQSARNAEAEKSKVMHEGLIQLAVFTSVHVSIHGRQLGC